MALRRTRTGKYPRTREMYIVVEGKHETKHFNYVIIDNSTKEKTVKEKRTDDLDEIYRDLISHQYDLEYVVCNRLYDLLCAEVPSVGKKLFFALRVDTAPKQTTLQRDRSGKTRLDENGNALVKEIPNYAINYKAYHVKYDKYKASTYCKNNQTLMIDSHNILKGIDYTGASDSYALMQDIGFVLDKFCQSYPISLGEITDVLFMNKYAPFHLKRPVDEELEYLRVFLGTEQYTPYDFNTVAKSMSTNKNIGVVPVPDQKYADFDVKGYYGGRNEAYYQGDIGYCTSFDKNAMYASIMMKYKFPYQKITNNFSSPDELASQRNGAVYNKLKDYLERGYLAMARVVVDIPKDIEIPPFPVYVNNQQIGKFNDVSTEYTIYPTGKFETVLSTPELILGYENNWINNVKQYTIYNKIDYFSEFVKDLNVYKEFGNHLLAHGDKGVNWFKCPSFHNVNPKVLKSIGKYGIILMFGKLAQKADTTPTTIQELASENVKNTDAFFKSKINSIEEVIKEARKYKFAYTPRPLLAGTHPAVSAHITAYGRVEMWKKIQELPKGSVVYMDTDGIIVKGHPEDYSQYFNVGSHIDEWKIEAEGECKLWSLKSYVIGGKEVHKNINDDVEWSEDMSTGIEYIKPDYKAVLFNGESQEYIKRSVMRSEKINNRHVEAINDSLRVTKPYDLQVIGVCRPGTLHTSIGAYNNVLNNRVEVDGIPLDILVLMQRRPQYKERFEAVLANKGKHVPVEPFVYKEDEGNAYATAMSLEDQFNELFGDDPEPTDPVVESGISESSISESSISESSISESSISESKSFL